LSQRFSRPEYNPHGNPAGIAIPPHISLPLEYLVSDGFRRTYLGAEEMFSISAFPFSASFPFFLSFQRIILFRWKPPFIEPV
jgi:hypothetical protein